MSAGMNPMNMMMGMMGGPMGMPPMGPMGSMGMPPMGPMGMVPMGMPPGIGPGGPEDGAKSKRKVRRASSGSSDDSGSSRPRSRPKSRSRRREPVRIEEVEKFIDDNRINEEAATKIRALSPGSQRRVIARPLTGDVQNPSKVMIARVRELQSQNERMKGNDMWSGWSGAMMGATDQMMNKYIEDNDLDDSASRQLRSLPPHHQAMALRWDLSGYRNPSAKFMSLANGLSSAPGPVGPNMPMPMPMFGMPNPMMMGMRPMGMPPMGMPPMPGMPPGMPPPGMGLPPPPPGGAPPGPPPSKKKSGGSGAANSAPSSPF